MSDNKFEDQHGPDNVPTITEKSSRRDPVMAVISPPENPTNRQSVAHPGNES